MQHLRHACCTVQQQPSASQPASQPASTQPASQPGTLSAASVHLAGGLSCAVFGVSSPISCGRTGANLQWYTWPLVIWYIANVPLGALVHCSVVEVSSLTAGVFLRTCLFVHFIIQYFSTSTLNTTISQVSNFAAAVYFSSFHAYQTGDFV